jgi:DNA-binding beta-propeller fold protein YncE
MRRWLLLGLGVLSSLGTVFLWGEPPSGPHRNPVAVAVLPGGRLAVSANQGADSVSLVDLADGKVLAELPCGRRPAGVACSADGRHVAVSNCWSGTLSLFEVKERTLAAAGPVAVGVQPRGVLFLGPDRIAAALAGGDEVVVVDRGKGRVVQRWPAPRAPGPLAVSKDGRWLAAASTRSAQARLWDLRSGKLAWERTIGDAFNLRGLAFTPDQKALLCAHVVRRSFPVARENIDHGWVTDSRLSRLPVAADALPPIEQVALDHHGRAVGDPDGLVFDSSERWLTVAAAGTHELLLLQAGALPWTGGDPGDFLDAVLDQGDGKLRRLAVGGRPLGVAHIPSTTQVVVANYLLDALQVVDVRAGKLVQTIALGGPDTPDLARRGEALFYDAQRSHNQWFSCNTCHVEGHTCGLNFDTLNDDSYGNPKLTPSLRGVTRTGPWTWHGWQKDLGASVTKSFTQTMFGPKPTADEVRAVVAYLGTLEQPPNPFRPGGKRSAAAERGRKLFEGKARCSRCHEPPDYTTPRSYDVKLEEDDSPYPRWNPPALVGLWERGPYLHDGRVGTLDELLQGFHAPEKLGGKALNEAERADLIAFLKSL